MSYGGRYRRTSTGEGEHGCQAASCRRVSQDKQRDREQPDRRAHRGQDQPPGVRAPRDRPGTACPPLLHRRGLRRRRRRRSRDRYDRRDCKPGGALRTGIIAPAIELNPLVVYDEGGLAVLGQSGSTSRGRTISSSSSRVSPRAGRRTKTARSGRSRSARASRSTTARLSRPGRRLHPQPQRDPKNEGNALSVGDPGGLSAGGAEAPDDATVIVTLNGPNGSFPYLVSSDNYNAIILPDASTGDVGEVVHGTGPGLDRFTPQQAVTYTKNPNYWDTQRQPLADTSEPLLRGRPGPDPRDTGRRGRRPEPVPDSRRRRGLERPEHRRHRGEGGAARQIHMRTDQEPFQDKRFARPWRSARPADDHRGFFQGKADIGNDSPFAPVYPYTTPPCPSAT